MLFLFSITTYFLLVVLQQHIKFTLADDTTSPSLAKTITPPVDLLRQAVLSGDVQSLAKLSKTLNINDVDPIDGRSLMHLAAHQGHLNIIYKLVELGEEDRIWTKDLQGSTPMHMAAGRGHCFVLSHLKGFGGDIEARDIDGRTPIHVAAAMGQVDCVDKLEELGAVVDTKDHAGMTPMHHGARMGWTNVVIKLEDLGTSIHSKDDRGWLPLHYAASGDDGSDGFSVGQGDDSIGSRNYSKIILFLHKMGTDVEEMDKEGRSSMHYAAAFGRVDVIQTLIKLNASIDAGKIVIIFVFLLIYIIL
jgi:ankyrin repeat protein